MTTDLLHALPALADAAPAAADATMLPGGWVISLVGAVIAAVAAAAAGWKIGERTLETRIAGQPIGVRRVPDAATSGDIKKIHDRLRAVETRTERILAELRAEDEARTLRLHDRIDKQDQSLREILRALGRIEGRRAE